MLFSALIQNATNDLDFILSIQSVLGSGYFHYGERESYGRVSCHLLIWIDSAREEVVDPVINIPVYNNIQNYILNT